MLKVKHGLVSVIDHEHGQIFAEAHWHRDEDLNEQMESFGYRKGQYQVLLHHTEENRSPWQKAYVNFLDLT